MKISEENIEEWCFRYLEKDLNEKECAFFEKELQTNSVLKKEYALWNKTKLTDASLGAKPAFNKNIYRFNTQILWAVLELTAVVGISIVCMHFIPSVKVPSEIHPDQKIKVVKENKTNTEQQSIPKNKVYILLNTKPNQSIVIQSENSVADSTLVVRSASEKQDSISPTDKKILLDTIQSPKDSIERKAKPKAKVQKRKNYNGSRLIPINNDL